MSDEVEVAVKWATSAGDYLPFTALPARYHGATVRLVIVDDPTRPVPFDLTDAGKAALRGGE